ncbi:4'-phosphopantetheinyl transferase family protein [Mangrovihabitans endophyticus]|uniref:4'-phosphopantetheinyl transferase n=1 Tax=Mangrovihabitans endophyticus TaxID=1751298 RepID=A0A8J3C5Y4_9ACTN|nr:4'-phosphopantetheinyl transferase superfamily protein [Mangrovihabitans endophyticus]GGL19661.1 4'-phosphopantetheinyl transferase [Mangrovihabitans endophyticus]
MIEALLPTAVIAVEAFEDIPGEAVFPGEEDLVANAVEGRRREFVTARRCAREALSRLGHRPAPIRPGPKREPGWPAGVAGSITHCAGYRAAAVAPVDAVAGVGIDAEPNGPLPDGVEESIALPAERAMLADLARARPATHWGRLLFSAKESVYKAWYPLTGRWLGFEDAHLTIDADAGTFRAQLLVDGSRTGGGPPLTVLSGRFLSARGLVVTAVTVLN